MEWENAPLFKTYFFDAENGTEKYFNISSKGFKDVLSNKLFK